MRLTRATPQAVRYACLNFHYAKSVPVNTIGYNVYNDGDEWCGVVLFGTGATPNIGKPYNLPMGGGNRISKSGVKREAKLHKPSGCDGVKTTPQRRTALPFGRKLRRLRPESFRHNIPSDELDLHGDGKQRESRGFYNQRQKGTPEIRLCENGKY